MTRNCSLRHEFVTYIPDTLEDGVLYVSIRYATVVHRCCCGCGNEVVTPLDPSDWEMMFDGKSISLSPSIGNWSLACQSHYWISRNKVRWARYRTVEASAAGSAFNSIKRAWQSALSQLFRRIRKGTRG